MLQSLPTTAGKPMGEVEPVGDAIYTVAKKKPFWRWQEVTQNCFQLIKPLLPKSVLGKELEDPEFSVYTSPFQRTRTFCDEKHLAACWTGSCELGQKVCLELAAGSG